MCIINVIQFPYRRGILLTTTEGCCSPGRIQYAVQFLQCVLTPAPFCKYFVLSILVSQPPIVAGLSTLFPLFVNGYYADEMFQSDQIVESHL